MQWASRVFSLFRKRKAIETNAREIHDASTRADFFNHAAADEEHYPSSIDPRIFHVKLLLAQVADCSGGWIADVGSGKGRFARLVQEKLPQSSLVAIDIATSMLEHVPAPIARVAASITALPLSTASCKAAYAIESLEHAVDIHQAVAELCRIVEVGGNILIIDKNVEHWGRFDTPGWEKWFDQTEIENLLRLHCSSVRSQFISYWEDVEPDGLFIAWLATK